MTFGGFCSSRSVRFCISSKAARSVNWRYGDQGGRLFDQICYEWLLTHLWSQYSKNIYTAQESHPPQRCGWRTEGSGYPLISLDGNLIPEGCSQLLLVSGKVGQRRTSKTLHRQYAFDIVTEDREIACVKWRRKGGRSEQFWTQRLSCGEEIRQIKSDESMKYTSLKFKPDKISASFGAQSLHLNFTREVTEYQTHKYYWFLSISPF